MALLDLHGTHTWPKKLNCYSAGFRRMGVKQQKLQPFAKPCVYGMQAGVLLSAIVLSQVCNVSDLASQSCLRQFVRCAANVFRCAVYCPRLRPSALNLPTAVLAKVAMCAIWL